MLIKKKLRREEKTYMHMEKKRKEEK